LPDKAIDVIDESGARVRLRSMTRPPDLQEIDVEIDQLNKDKEYAVANQDFEKAAALRDVMFAMKKTLRPQRRFSRAPRLDLPGADEAAEELRVALGMPEPPRIMECFDISHISGSFVVASMVRFDDGRPDKSRYRRFKIKSFVGNDDFRAMEEVVGRRYRRIKEEGRQFPDLVVIDGGVGQVRAALKALLVQDIRPPMLIGLAKRDIPADTLGALHVTGVFDFPKATGSGQSINAGAQLYWDAGAAQATTDDGAGANKAIGKAVVAAGEDDETVRVRLTQ